MADSQIQEAALGDLRAALAAVVRDQFRAHPSLARGSGDHSADGQVAEAGVAAGQRRIAELVQLRDRLDRLGQVDLPDSHLDLEVARGVVESELFSLQVRRRPSTDPTTLLDQDSPLEVGGYLLRDYAPLTERISALCRQLEQAQEWTEAALAALDPHLAAPLIELATRAVEGHLGFLRDEVSALAQEIGDDSLRRRLTAAVKVGEEALTRISVELDLRRDPDHHDVALGADGLRAMLLAQEGLERSIPELRQEADQELESLREQRAQLLAERFGDREIVEVRAELEQDQFGQGDLISGARDLVEELRTFVEQRAEVPIPDGPACEVRATPGFMSAWVSAAYEGVGPLERKPLSGVYYVTTPQPSWSATEADEWLRYLNRATLKNTSVHEVYPGHHVQHLHAQRLSSDVRRFFWTPGFGEGWAHYAELLMVERGLGDDDPLLQLAQIEDALLRGCRYRTAVGVHAEGWSVEDGTRLFMDRIGVDHLPARREAMRATFDPLYLVYTLGKLEILKWRDEFQRSGRGDLRAFHRLVLGAGSPPLAALGRWLRSQ